MTPQAIIAHAQRANVTLVRFLYCGSDGIIRGKMTHIAHLERRLMEGMSLPLALTTLTSLDQPVLHGPVGEVRLLPDLTTFTLVPYVARQARLFCNLMDLNHQPWSSCPRSFLQRMLDHLARHSLHVQAAFETEFYLLCTAGGQQVPFDSAPAYSTIGMDATSPVILDIVDALTVQGIQVEQYHPEYGPGQHEVSIRHTDGVPAADQQLAVRDTIRGVAARHGLIASLAPHPLAGRAGNGCHIHFSLWDETRQHNFFYAPHDPWHLSPLGYQFIAGILAHVSALVALTAPSVASYQRLRPGLWSGAYACYGPDNREAAIRICSPAHPRDMASMNLELRACDPSCNPYLALGGLLASGLDGVVRQLQPDAPVVHSPTQRHDETGLHIQSACLPETLEDALAALQQDPVLMSALGEELTQEYLTVKRTEIAALQGKDPVVSGCNHCLGLDDRRVPRREMLRPNFGVDTPPQSR